MIALTGLRIDIFDMQPTSSNGATPLMRSENLPVFTFIDKANGEERLDLSTSGNHVNAAAQLFQARIPAGSVVGLLAKTGPDLVLNWLGCLVAGLRPLILQYPTEKQSRKYWCDSITNILSVAGIEAIIAEDATAGLLSTLGTADRISVLTQAEINKALSAGQSEPHFAISNFSIVQLSSGTTGFRKAIEFRSDAIAQHVSDYNKTLELTPSRDAVVSWLPLYHDMGYVACFVMPMLLGIPVYCMDPMAWVANPQMLFDAIVKYRPTICYMPNFGFEVMSRFEASDLSSMRWWISCSEPVAAATARKFLQKIGCEADRFAPCYAMAENIFAVSIRRGLEVQEIEGTEVVSCGAPIENVDIKIVESEIFVRSPSSLEAYIGGQPITDAEGFYPTGDLGALINGELFVSGRKQDLVIQAGRKFMLSDVDLHLNRLLPEVRGRGAAVQIFDERLGTSKPVVLIEALDFFERDDEQKIASALSAVTGIDHLEVAFVPPRFLTKTSSGKFNKKKSAADWLLAHRASMRTADKSIDVLIAELRQSFKRLDWSLPVAEVLDSLSLTVFRIILGEAGLAFDGTKSLANYEADLQALATRCENQAAQDVIHIVSLADRSSTKWLRQEDLDRLSEFFGTRVVFEHLCLPPSPIVLSDAIFYDYFAPRLTPEPFESVSRAMETLKRASIVIVDDVAEMFFPPKQVYGVLSHNLERDPRADLIAVRWQRYSRNHHELPLTVVSGADLPLHTRAQSIQRLGKYLKKPIFRVATIGGYRAYTADWELRKTATVSGATGGQEVLKPGELADAIIDWVKSGNVTIPTSRRIRGTDMQIDDLSHFCSHYTLKTSVEKVLDRFSTFCISGQPSSIPFIAKTLDTRGKHYTRVPSYAPEVLKTVEEDFDVVLVCGSQGRYEVRKPLIAMMRADASWLTKNIEDTEISGLRFSAIPSEFPQSGLDWYFQGEFNRSMDRVEIAQVRRSAAAAVKRTKAARERRRAARARRTAAVPLDN